MFKKFVLIISIALGLVVSGCASFDYETRPFFSGFGEKIDCSQNSDGSIFRVRSQRLCSFERWSY